MSGLSLMQCVDALDSFEAHLDAASTELHAADNVVADVSAVLGDHVDRIKQAIDHTLDLARHARRFAEEALT